MLIMPNAAMSTPPTAIVLNHTSDWTNWTCWLMNYASKDCGVHSLHGRWGVLVCSHPLKVTLFATLHQIGSWSWHALSALPVSHWTECGAQHLTVLSSEFESQTCKKAAATFSFNKSHKSVMSTERMHILFTFLKTWSLHFTAMHSRSVVFFSPSKTKFKTVDVTAVSFACPWTWICN